jgi:hypothetical protein
MKRVIYAAPGPDRKIYADPHFILIQKVTLSENRNLNLCLKYVTFDFLQ